MPAIRFERMTTVYKLSRRFLHISQVTDLPNTAREAPVAFVTTEQRKAGLIPAKLPQTTVLFGHTDISGVCFDA